MTYPAAFHFTQRRTDRMTWAETNAIALEFGGKWHKPSRCKSYWTFPDGSKAFWFGA